MLYIVDNYDSFVYNIVHSISLSEERIIIKRNDLVDLNDIAKGSIKGVIISPGPMSPKKAGLSNDVIRLCGELNKPVLGICLGHQCIGAVYGSRVEKCAIPMHGKSSMIRLLESEIFKTLPKEIMAGRYHSLYLPNQGLNYEVLKIIATLEDGLIMGVEHKTLPIFGVQFHPESILTTEYGSVILNNFLQLCKLI